MKLSEQNQKLLLGILGKFARQYSDMAKDLEWKRRLALLHYDIKTAAEIACKLNYIQMVALQYETLVNVYTDFQLSL